MRFLLALIISFQFVSAPVVAAELGEAQPFTVRNHLINSMAKAETREFESNARLLIEQASTEGIKGLTTDEYVLSRINAKPVFVEKTPGSWEFKADGHKITFTLLDLYQGQMNLNGKVLKYKNVPYSVLEKNAEKILSTKKVSFLKIMFDKTIGIESADAAIFLILVAVFAVAIIGVALNELMFKPAKMVKRLKELKAKLDKDAVACNEAKNDSTKYDQTFSLASSISDKSAYSSTSPADAMEFALKKQLDGSERKNQDCFQIMHEVGKKVNLDIKVPTAQQISRRENLEAAGSESLKNEEFDVASAAFNLCSSYNQLGSCMENFVAAHVNDSDISSFKDQATQSHWRYQKKAGVGRQ